MEEGGAAARAALRRLPVVEKSALLLGRGPVGRLARRFALHAQGVRSTSIRARLLRLGDLAQHAGQLVEGLDPSPAGAGGHGVVAPALLPNGEARRAVAEVGESTVSLGAPSGMP